MRVIRAAACRRMPWKNGGGETLEIATYPEGAGLDTFVWRLSTAQVAEDGPFSTFAGVDRTLAVLSGEGLELRVAGTTTRLGPDDAPVSFPGDHPTEARLLGGPIADFNIMTRRGAARHRMRRVAMNGPVALDAAGSTVLLFCADGRLEIGDAALGARDTAVLAETGARAVDVNGRGTLYVVGIEAVP